MSADAESNGTMNGHAAGTAVLDRVRAVIAKADAKNQPRPSQAELAESLATSRHHVRQALAKLSAERATGDTASGPEQAEEQPPATAGDQHATGSPAFTPVAPPARQPAKLWPLILIGVAPAVAIWAGWVDLGRLTGFGPVQLLPGIWDDIVLNTAVTLPISVEAYAAYAFRIWLGGSYSAGTTRFAKRSALGSLAVGGLAQVAYHLLIAAGFDHAPWWVTTLVACIPVGVFGLAAVLAHMARHDHQAGGQQ
jgi:hypothetical protein